MALKIELGQKATPIEDGKYFTKGRKYQIVAVNDGNVTLIDDEGEEHPWDDSAFMSHFKAVEQEAPNSFFTLPEPQADETPLDHFGQAANDNDGVPQTSKDAYAEIARSLGHAVIAHIEAGDYEQALKCAALMRRAEMEPVEALKVTVNMDQCKRDEIADLMRHVTRFGHTGGIIGEKPWAKTMLVMPDGFAADVAKRTFKDSPDVRVVTPTAAEISSRTVRTIIVHPGVDLDQEIEGQGRLRDLLIKRQQTFGADARLLTLTQVSTESRLERGEVIRGSD